MIYIGMDGGGTKIAVLAQRHGEADRHAYTGPGVNPQRVGLDACVENIVAVLKQIRADLGENAPLRVFAGLAGAGRATEQRLIEHKVEAQVPGDVRVNVTHDADIALDAAFPGASGTVIIAGTGSVVLARTPDRKRWRVGGWGYLLGDEGSGTALGLDAIRHICHAIDGGPHTGLVQLARETHGFVDGEHIIRALYHEKWPAQRGARMVLDLAQQGDTVAQDILTTQTRSLAQQVAWLYRRAPLLEPRYVLLGGLSTEPVYRDALVAALAVALPTWICVEPSISPTHAALLCAEAMGD